MADVHEPNWRELVLAAVRNAHLMHLKRLPSAAGELRKVCAMTMAEAVSERFATPIDEATRLCRLAGVDPAQKLGDVAFHS